MATSHESNQDAITEEEMTGTTTGALENKKRNAFSELMSPKVKKSAEQKSTPHLSFAGRDGLGAYIHDPTSFPRSRVISYDDDYVCINDMYPKSSVHTLLLPRGPQSRLHPFDAFEDPTFLSGVRKEADVLRGIVAKELQRRYGKFSKQDQARERILNGEQDIPLGDELPQGRDWRKEIKVGIHAHPSMSHLHVHVLSIDHFSEALRHRKHYTSFTTPFLVELEAFPLAQDDVRRHPGKQGYLDADLICWRCKKNYGHKFTSFKAHLVDEFETWKKE